MIEKGMVEGIRGGIVGPLLRPRVVLKLGGSTMVDARLEAAFADDVAWLVEEGADVVVVHGGGAGITALADALGVETRFVDGQRITDESTIELVEMTLAGRLNKEIVRTLRAHDVNGFGLSGVDGGLLVGTRDRGGVLGLVGRIEDVATDLLDMLWRSRHVPVVAPLAISRDGDVLNVNADVAAAAIAEAVGAVSLVYLSDVEGIRTACGVVETLDADGIAELIAAREITGGMVPKVRSALASIESGVGSVAIIDGTRAGAVRAHFMGRSVGTQIVAPIEARTPMLAA